MGKIKKAAKTAAIVSLGAVGGAALVVNSSQAETKARQANDWAKKAGKSAINFVKGLFTKKDSDSVQQSTTVAQQ